MSQNISYKLLLNALPEAALVLDAEASIVAVNQTVLQLLHCKADEVLERSLESILADAYALFLQLKEGSTKRQESMLWGRFFEASLSPLEQKENTAYYLLLLQDITVSKLTEQALLSQEQRFRALFEHSNDAIFILDTDLSILMANEQASMLLQEDRARLLQENALHYFHRGEHNLIRHYLDRLLNGENIPTLFDATFLDSQENGISVEVNLSLVRDNESKQVLHIQLIARDIRERRANQETMRSRIEQLVILRAVDEEINRSLDINHVLGVSLDAAMRLGRADAAFIALTEADKLTVTHVAGLYPEHVIGSPISYRIGVVGRVLEHHEPEFIINVDADPDYYKDINSTEALMAFPLISQERLLGILNLETSNRKRFNHAIFEFIQLLVSRIAVAIENARLYEYVRKQLDELSTLYDDLRDAERLKTDMMRIANHDLKNPLSIVRGYVDLMEMDIGIFPEAYQDYVITMRQSLERADQILHDFLSAEAITARAQGIISERFDMLDLVFRAIGEYKPAIQTKKLELSYSLLDKGLAVVKGDEAQIYEAISNLISNAIKYTPESGKIQIALILNEFHEVEFIVRDTGYGIPEDRQARLFEPFYRPSTTETAEIEGTGLGLHLVKNIIERHHGELHFESVYQQGSSFHFNLPLALPD